MSDLRSQCAEGNVEAVAAQLKESCAEQLGPFACAACALTGVVAAALESNADVARCFLRAWLPDTATNVQSVSKAPVEATTGVSTCSGPTAGAAADCSDAKKVQPGASAHAAETGEWQGLFVASSTDTLSSIKCFRDHFYNEINLKYIHYRLRDLRHGSMPAVLKAAALAGSVEVLHVLLEAYPNILDGNFSNPQKGPRAVALGTLHNAAAHGRVAFLTALFERDLELRGDMLALRLAFEDGHADAVRCLLARHGAGERRTQLAQGGLASLASIAGREGRLSMLHSMQHWTKKEEGLSGESLMDAALKTDEHHLKFGFWTLLECALEKGTPADVRVLLQHRSTALALASVQAEYGNSQEEVLAKKLVECAMKLMNSMRAPKQAAQSLKLLLQHPLPRNQAVDWTSVAHRAALYNWADGLRVLLLEMPSPHPPVRPNDNDSRLFRQACCQNNVEAAEVLLQVTGAHAVDPRARHQAAMRTACWRNMPRIVELLLRQTGERAVRMQPGKRSFFWGALRPHYRHVRTQKYYSDESDSERDHSDEKGGTSGGGYGALKLLLGATGVSAVPPSMWAHGGDGTCKRADLWGTAERGPVERLYRDVGWGGGIQRMARRDMVLLRCQDKA